MIDKQCCTCKQWKPISEFTRDKHRVDGHRVRCRECVYKERKSNKEQLDPNKMTLKEVAITLRICELTARKYLQQGLIKSTKVNNYHWQVTHEDFDRFLKEGENKKVTRLIKQ